LAGRAAVPDDRVDLVARRLALDRDQRRDCTSFVGSKFPGVRESAIRLHVAEQAAASHVARKRASWREADLCRAFSQVKNTQ
jgi:hypothetical protein